MEAFVIRQSKLNHELRDKIAMLEQDNRTRERREDLGEVEINTRTIDGLVARVVHLERRVLDLERVSAINERKKRALGDGDFSSFGGTNENTDENMKLFENTIKYPIGKDSGIKNQDIKKDISKYLVGYDKQ